MMTFSLSALRRPLLVGLTALSVAVGGFAASAVPARAQSSDDLLRFLAGAAAVAVIVHAWDRNRSSSSSSSSPRYTSNVLPEHCRETLRRGRNDLDVYNAQCLREAGLRNLPNRCEQTVRTDRGSRRVFSRQCLIEAGYRAERSTSPRRGWDRPGRHSQATLPAACSMTYTRGNQRLTGYYSDCLERYRLRNLPERCRLDARIVGRGGGQLSIYGEQCLISEGFRPERGRR